MMVLVGALALGAVASASASAVLPEIVNSKGAELVKKKFTGEVTQPMTAEIEGVGDEECKKLEFAGEVKGTKGGEGTLTLHCDANCHTKGLKEKEIKLPVSVNLVWRRKATEKSVALLLSVPGVTDLEGYCWSRELSSLEVSGSLLLPVKVTNKPSTEYKFALRQNGGFQEAREYENEAGEKEKAQLETTAPGASEWKNRALGLENEFPLKFEEAAEFKV